MAGRGATPLDLPVEAEGEAIRGDQPSLFVLFGGTGRAVPELWLFAFSEVVFVATEAYCADSPTWACAALKKLGFCPPRAAWTISGKPVWAVRGGLVVTARGARAAAPPGGLRPWQGRRTCPILPGQCPGLKVGVRSAELGVATAGANAGGADGGGCSNRGAGGQGCKGWQVQTPRVQTAMGANGRGAGARGADGRGGCKRQGASGGGGARPRVQTACRGGCKAEGANGRRCKAKGANGREKCRRQGCK